MTLSSLDRGQRREALLAAADTVVRRHGAAATMAAIAAEAGITKPILYRHFLDKRGLYAALAERHTDRLLDALVDSLGGGGTTRERVHRTISTYLAVIEDEPEVYRFLVESDEAVAAREPLRGFVRRLQDLLALGIGHELALPENDPRARVYAAGIVGMVQAAGERWLEVRDLDRGVLAKHLTDLLWGAYPEQASRR